MIPALLAAQGPEFDLGRVVFIIMLLVGGFLQWLSNWWKRKQAEVKAMRPAPQASEDEAAMERAWQRQTGGGDHSPSQPVARNPLEDLLKTLRELAAPEIEPPPVPAPLPPELRTAPVVQSPKPRPAPAMIPSAPQAAVPQRSHHPLAVKLGGVESLRQAVVLREILGPPKALQTSDDHLI